MSGSASASRGPRVLLTGSSGFVGGRLREHLLVSGFDLSELGREELAALTNDRSTAFCNFKGCHAVVHVAGRAHVLAETSQSLLSIYRKANRDTTLALARAAAAAGIARFVFLSSIRVNGPPTQRPFTAADTPSPDEPYAISKHEAEQGLWEIARETVMEVVVLRPPLVYGPGVKANFLRLLELSASGLPLPLASVSGVRSLISVWNLCDLLQRCLQHTAAAGKTFLAADGENVTLPVLIKSLAAAMGRPCRLFSASPTLLRIGATALGKRATFDKLVSSLQVDISATRNTLSWEPPVSLADGLAATGRWYAQTHLTRHAALAEGNR